MTRDMFGGYSEDSSAVSVKLFDGHGYLDQNLLKVLEKYQTLFAGSSFSDYDLCIALQDELLPLGFVFKVNEDFFPYDLETEGDPLPQNCEAQAPLTALEKRAIRRRKDRNIEEPLHSKYTARRLWIKSASNPKE